MSTLKDEIERAAKAYGAACELSKDEEIQPAWAALHAAINRIPDGEVVAPAGATVSYGVLAEIAQFFNLDYNDLIEVVDNWERAMIEAAPTTPAASGGVADAERESFQQTMLRDAQDAAAKYGFQMVGLDTALRWMVREAKNVNATMLASAGVGLFDLQAISNAQEAMSAGRPTTMVTDGAISPETKLMMIDKLAKARGFPSIAKALESLPPLPAPFDTPKLSKELTWEDYVAIAQAATDYAKTYARAALAQQVGAGDSERLDWIERKVCDVSRLGDSARTVRISWNNGADYVSVGPSYCANWREAIDTAMAYDAARSATRSDGGERG